MRTKLGLVLFVAATSGAGVGAGGPQDPPTFKSAVELVPISAVVRDGRHRLVTNLSARDFVVFDNGAERRIVDFVRDQAGTVTVALLVDVSGSMRIGPKLPVAREVLERMTGELRDGRDEAGLFTFDAGLHEQQPFTLHPGAMGSVFDSVEPFGTTSLFDAIAATARLVAGRPPRRRAIIVFTDGVDTSSALAPSEVSALASSVDVPIYIVVTVPPVDEAQLVNQLREAAPRAADLRDLAQWTGGDLLFATTPEQAAARAHEIVMELRHQYLIAIEAADRTEWRALDVRVRDRRLTVRARSGYFGRELPLSK